MLCTTVVEGGRASSFPSSFVVIVRCSVVERAMRVTNRLSTSREHEAHRPWKKEAGGNWTRPSHLVSKLPDLLTIVNHNI